MTDLLHMPASAAEWVLMLTGGALGLTFALIVGVFVFSALRQHYERKRREGKLSRRCQAVASGPWSDPATWAWRDVPEVGDSVVIPENITVTIDDDAIFE